MNKQFIPYDLALKLKDLGFDEPCLACYNTDKHFFIRHMGNCLAADDYERNSGINPDFGIFTCPLWQQAFEWFREKYSLFHNIWNYTHGEPTNLLPNGFTFSIDEDWITIVGKKEDGYFEKYYPTYEEAQEACLIKLIAIVQDEAVKNR